MITGCGIYEDLYEGAYENVYAVWVSLFKLLQSVWKDCMPAKLMPMEVKGRGE